LFIAESKAEEKDLILFSYGNDCGVRGGRNAILFRRAKEFGPINQGAPFQGAF